MSTTLFHPENISTRQYLTTPSGTMAHSPNFHDRGTRFTNYSSIHSADAWVGEYQVMFTPGSTSPQMNRPAARKPSRFSRGVAASKATNNNQSYILPSNVPNTSQIMPDQGALPNIQVHCNIPADEKQIVASLRSLQRDLAEAIQTINEITRERDEALHELRLLRATSRKPSSPAKKQSIAERVEEELFDLSGSGDSIQQHVRPQTTKKVAIEREVTASDDARVLSDVPINVANGARSNNRQPSKTANNSSKAHRKQNIEVSEQSIVAEENTAASNVSRRRRRPSFDDNMTSAYILPDITESQPKHLPRQSQHVSHNHESEHVAKCEMCHRLTATSKAAKQGQPKRKSVEAKTNPQPSSRQQPVVGKIDYTAQALGFGQNKIGFAIEESYLADPTMRPKISPGQALTRVRMLMEAQFVRAKERHNDAWTKYDSIDAPTDSRRHAQVGKEMRYWAEKMEECRVHLDYLRDVEEGVEASEGAA